MLERHPGWVFQPGRFDAVRPWQAGGASAPLGEWGMARAPSAGKQWWQVERLE